MTSPSARTKGLDLAFFTPYRMVVLGRKMSEQLGAAYAGENLTIPEWRVLAVVSQEPAVAARDVVARTPMDKMAVSRAVAALEEKGLITRGPAADRRVSALSLSVKGQSVFDRISAIAHAYEAKLTGAMAPAARDGFFAGLDVLEAAVDAADKSDEKPKAAE